MPEAVIVATARTPASDVPLYVPSVMENASTASSPVVTSSPL